MNAVRGWIVCSTKISRIYAKSWRIIDVRNGGKCLMNGQLTKNVLSLRWTFILCFSNLDELNYWRVNFNFRKRANIKISLFLKVKIHLKLYHRTFMASTKAKVDSIKMLMETEWNVVVASCISNWLVFELINTDIGKTCR